MIAESLAAALSWHSLYSRHQSILDDYTSQAFHLASEDVIGASVAIGQIVERLHLSWRSPTQRNTPAISDVVYALKL